MKLNGNQPPHLNHKPAPSLFGLSYRSFVKEVRVAGDQVVVTYTMPILPNGLSGEGIVVPRIIQYSGRYRT